MIGGVCVNDDWVSCRVHGINGLLETRPAGWVAGKEVTSWSSLAASFGIGSGFGGVSGRLLPACHSLNIDLSLGFVDVPRRPDVVCLSTPIDGAFRSRAKQALTLIRSLGLWGEPELEFSQVFDALGDDMNSRLRDPNEGALTLEMVELDRRLGVFFNSFEGFGRESLLFRGESHYESREELLISLNELKDESGAVVFPAYFRTSPELRRAHGFAMLAAPVYPVLFQVLSSGGLYAGSTTSNAAHEREVLLNKGSRFELVGVEEVPFFDAGDPSRSRPLGVVYLRELPQ